MRLLKLTDAEMDRWEEEQVTFFTTLGEEEPYDPREIAYVELLQQLPVLESKRQQRYNRFLAFEPIQCDQTMYVAQISETRKLETERRLAIEQYNQTLADIVLVEERLGIGSADCWTPAHPRYQAAVKFLEERRYRRALDRIQALVIQRLFELHKLNLAQTGDVVSRILRSRS